MGRPQKYRTPEEEEEGTEDWPCKSCAKPFRPGIFRSGEARRATGSERMRRLRANSEYRAEAAAAKRRRKADDSEFRAGESQRSRLNVQRRHASDSGYRAMENFQRLIHRSTSGADGRLQREFLSIEFGHGCRVCHRLWFDANLSTMSSVTSITWHFLAKHS